MTWLQTRSGTAVDVASDSVEGIRIPDLAMAIGNLCRFNGHTRRLYTVAEHSVRMHDWAILEGLGSRVGVACLVHDLHEGLVGDVIHPLQAHLHGYRELADHLEARVRAVALEGLANLDDWPDPAAWATCKELDLRILIDERDALLGPSPRPGGWPDVEPLGIAEAIRCLGVTGPIGWMAWGRQWLKRWDRYRVTR